MGRTLRELRFSIIVNKFENWSPRYQAECDDTNSGYDDWVIGQLESVMRAAGEQFIATHPSLFSGELM